MPDYDLCCIPDNLSEDEAEYYADVWIDKLEDFLEEENKPKDPMKFRKPAISRYEIDFVNRYMDKDVFGQYSFSDLMCAYATAFHITPEDLFARSKRNAEKVIDGLIELAERYAKEEGVNTGRICDSEEYLDYIENEISAFFQNKGEIATLFLKEFGLPVCPDVYWRDFFWSQGEYIRDIFWEIFTENFECVEEADYVPEEYEHLYTRDRRSIMVWKSRVGDWTVGIQGTSFWVAIPTKEEALEVARELTTMTLEEALRWRNSRE